MPTLYSPAFFDLQLRFAQHVARVRGVSVEDAVLHTTNIPLHFLRRPFQLDHPLWQEYWEGLIQAKDGGEWTYRFCERFWGYSDSSPYGCFRYDYREDEQLIRIHFLNDDPLDVGPLSKARMQKRIEELTTMFTDIKRLHPAAQKVKGRSWLYNLEAYRRLFPAEYGKNPKVIEDDLCGLVLWGQFLQRDGQVHDELVTTLLDCSREKQAMKELMECFPYPVLEPECSLDAFYLFYNRWS
ncbi:hypothetical protein [Tengunoibacter tsumagoiensis]|uniref:Uncharacterized protein n=1 Tax=Tengunoibacter tsumagoiensis TaxID=2014871 RepID=A0A402A9G9_9CHLR|nr:hypothetical protein [Tengunoibacter tsumagoiensis]GCE15601.1 hypothetical protein KTT_54600 [Tengunoibacter tsumagoiensis]